MLDTMDTLDENTLTTLYAYLDNELSLADCQNFERQLALNPDLKIALQQEEAFRARFRRVIQAEQASESLHDRINEILTNIETERLAPNQTGWWQQLKEWITSPRPVSPLLAASYTVLLLLLVSSALLFLPVNKALPTVLEDHTVFRQMAGKDRVYLRQSPPMIDVEGSPIEVQTWFRHRSVALPVVPALPDWHLQGGLLGEFHHQGIAHLIYKYRDEHFSLFVFTPQEKDFPSNAIQMYKDKQFFVGTDEGQAVVIWGTPEIAYALVGPLGSTITDLLPLAKTLTIL